MIRDDDARDLSLGVEADEHLDRTVEAALERLELRRPVREAEQLALLAGGRRSERFVMRRVAALRGERSGVRKQLLELRRELSIVRALAARADGEDSDAERQRREARE